MRLWFTKKQLQIISATTVFYLFILIPVYGNLLFIWLAFKAWYLALFYLIWFIYDRKTEESGGRPIEWVQRWKLWQYGKDYFPSKLIISPNFALEFKKNYLFCCFPHGLIPNGVFYSLVSGASDFRKQYSTFEVRLAVLYCLTEVLLLKELSLALSFISCSTKSLNYVLSKPEGGHVVVLMPGGNQEMKYAIPGQYKLNIKSRKGFIKVALINGASLVPVVTFGENDVFEQIQGKRLLAVQDFVKTWTKAFLPVFYGRGITKNSIGLFPVKKPLTTVLGKPIDVDKITNPTNEQVDELHGKFIKELVTLFETNKHKYLENGASCSLELI